MCGISPWRSVRCGRARRHPRPGYPTSEGLRLLADLAGAGSLRVVVDRAYAFDDIADAFAGYGRQTLGNIVVRIP